ncbi:MULTISPECIES: hypothetical protein [Protofrankia]|uniref:Uncharacterized protein n=1 Tax=Candidatus Protofrankia datiscae TaxID=2716812 RepID=F8AX12_9ACTN|nr:MULTISPECIES: hypothetical protein [Protofrankia]AEH11461.1 hypothetical protein FsymDg_4196 [Candidatus Protofrankia datiscae]
MSTPTLQRITAPVPMAAAMADWQHTAARLWIAAREYAEAVTSESDVMTSLARLIADGAPDEEIDQARALLTHLRAVRAAVGRRLGLTELSDELARAGWELLSAVPSARECAIPRPRQGAA